MHRALSTRIAEPLSLRVALGRSPTAATPSAVTRKWLMVSEMVKPELLAAIFSHRAIQEDSLFLTEAKINLKFLFRRQIPLFM